MNLPSKSITRASSLPSLVMACNSEPCDRPFGWAGAATIDGVPSITKSSMATKGGDVFLEIETRTSRKIAGTNGSTNEPVGSCKEDRGEGLCGRLRRVVGGFAERVFESGTCEGLFSENERTMMRCNELH